MLKILFLTFTSSIKDIIMQDLKKTGKTSCCTLKRKIIQAKFYKLHEFRLRDIINDVGA